MFLSLLQMSSMTLANGASYLQNDERNGLCPGLSSADTHSRVSLSVSGYSPVLVLPHFQVTVSQALDTTSIFTSAPLYSLLSVPNTQSGTWGWESSFCSKDSGYVESAEHLPLVAVESLYTTENCRSVSPYSHPLAHHFISSFHPPIKSF